MPTPKVIDLSHHNWDSTPNLDFAQAKASGIVGVIYKATEGATYQDPFYHKTHAAALKAGLLWGAYHFATKAPAAAQAQNFLNTVNPDGEMLVALDFEKNEPSPGNTTTPQIALDVLARIEQAIGRRPTLYTGGFMTDNFGHQPAPAFAPYRLWWATYGAAPNIHPTWNNYWLWQYTDGVHGPATRSVPGIGPCDCNTYAGTDVQLEAEWAQ